MPWTPIWALPNINLDEAVDSEFFSLAPFADDRAQEIWQRLPRFQEFISRFTDTFGRPITPTLLLVREGAPESLKTADASASFRDLLVASVVPYSRSRHMVHDNVLSGVPYSSYFWVHPWMLGRNEEYLVAETPGMWAVDEAEEFCGQSSPELSPATLRRADFDEPLLQELLQRFLGRYTVGRPTWQDVALFRSLNMANRASLFPAGVDATIHDFGRTVGLWVAAFEILVHPGGDGQANLTKVSKLLEDIPWSDGRLAFRRYETGKGNRRVRRNLACWVYKQINSCRNDFLHGNPVGISNLLLPKSRRPVNSVVPVLYRLALTSFLDLSWKEPPVPAGDEEAFVEHERRKSRFMAPQREVEQALRLSRVSVEQQRRERQALLEQYRQNRLRRRNNPHS